ncbi:UNKNOWN [Stylonychia lemnae]|uniref:Uncharacterized protein n=1 Tax=Stylonychia lemnae TaxID=5949 RepID=A0A077ZVU8_STYLE|nr:UNKNOWN [Stylonychia lemnae]|eukprot:CDW73726.1 UNKNOWN [Stylonychia lemnae]
MLPSVKTRQQTNQRDQNVLTNIETKNFQTTNASHIALPSISSQKYSAYSVQQNNCKQNFINLVKKFKPIETPESQKQQNCEPLSTKKLLERIKSVKQIKSCRHLHYQDNQTKHFPVSHQRQQKQLLKQTLKKQVSFLNEQQVNSQYQLLTENICDMGNEKHFKTQTTNSDISLKTYSDTRENAQQKEGKWLEMESRIFNFLAEEGITQEQPISDYKFDIKALFKKNSGLIVNRQKQLPSILMKRGNSLKQLQQYSSLTALTLSNK